MGYTSLLFTYLLTAIICLVITKPSKRMKIACKRIPVHTVLSMSRYSWHITETTQLALRPAHPKHVSTKFAVQTEFSYC